MTVDLNDIDNPLLLDSDMPPGNGSGYSLQRVSADKKLDVTSNQLATSIDDMHNWTSVTDDQSQVHVAFGLQVPNSTREIPRPTSVAVNFHLSQQIVPH